MVEIQAPEAHKVKELTSDVKMKLHLDDLIRQLNICAQACEQACRLVTRVQDNGLNASIPIDLSMLVKQNNSEFAAMIDHVRSAMEGLPNQM